MFFSKYVPKKELYRMYGGLVFAVMFVAVFYRVSFMFLFDIAFVWWETFIWLAFGAVIVYLVFVGPFYHENKAYREVSKLELYRTDVTKDKKTLPNPMNLLVDEVTRIVINLKNGAAESLKDRLTSKLYNVYRSMYLKQQIVEDLSQSNPDNRQGKLNLLSKVSQMIDELQNPERQTSSADLEQYSEDIMTSAKNEGVDLSQLIQLEDFEIEKIAKDKNKLEDLLGELEEIVFYHIVLAEPGKFPDETEEDEWGEFLIMTEDTAPNLLETHKAQGLYDQWLIHYRRCKMSLVYWRKLAKAMPLFYLEYSENQAINDNHMVNKLTKESNAYIQLQVDGVWMNQIINEPESLRRLKDFYEQKAASMEQDMSNMVQKLAKTSLVFGDFMKEERIRELEKTISKYKKRTYGALATVLAVICIFIAIIAFIV
jgi:hypothetical protein